MTCDTCGKCRAPNGATGAHVTAWNALRYYGPVASCRFDAHDRPPREVHPLPVITAVVQQCRADLDSGPSGAIPELLERGGPSAAERSPARNVRTHQR